MDDLKKMYEEGGNIMRFFRGDTGKNDQNAILYSYDMQSGSYTEYYEKNTKSDIKRNFIFRGASAEMTYAKYYDIFGKYIAGILDGLKIKNFVEAGIGEATSACAILKNMKTKPDFCGGFDLSLSRIMHGNKFATGKGENIDFAAASLFNMPFTDNSIDCALTIHAIEPNTSREEDALKELYRVAAKYVVMLEPDYGLGNDLTKAHIEKHGYIKNLAGTAEKLGMDITEHKLCDVMSLNNNSSVIIISKNKNFPPPTVKSKNSQTLSHAPFAIPNWDPIKETGFAENAA